MHLLRSSCPLAGFTSGRYRVLMPGRLPDGLRSLQAQVNRPERDGPELSKRSAWNLAGVLFVQCSDELAKREPD